MADFIGAVLKATRVDTIEVKHDGVTEVVQLFGVKAPMGPPELTERALAATKRLCMKKDVSVHVICGIKYGKVLGVVTLPDQRRLDLILLSYGYVRWDRLAAPDDTVVRNREEGARKAGRGLWAAKASDDEPSNLMGADVLIHAVPSEAEQVYLVSFSRHYHRPRCPYLNQPGLSITKAEAFKRGYTPCPVCGRYRVPQALKGTRWIAPATLPHRDSVESPLPIPRLDVAPASPTRTVRSRD